MGVALNIQTNYIELQNWLEKAKVFIPPQDARTKELMMAF